MDVYNLKDGTVKKKLTDPYEKSYYENISNIKHRERTLLVHPQTRLT